MDSLKNYFSKFFTEELPFNFNDDKGNVNVQVEPVKEIIQNKFEKPTRTIRGKEIDKSKPKRVFKYVSDLHLEMRRNIGAMLPIYQFEKEENTRYFLAVVGDIGSPYHRSDNLIEFLTKCSEVYEQVFYVMGNHEYYNQANFTMEEVYVELKSICSRFDNVHLMENKVFQLDEYKIIGTTCWSKVELNVDTVSRCLNDYRLIKTFDFDQNQSQDGKLKVRRIKVEDTNKLFDMAYDFLKEEIFENNKDNSPCIVLTHHAPQFNDERRNLYTSHPQYKCDDPIAEAFATNLSELLKNPVVCWIYGHTHYSSTYKYNGVSILSNQFGYESGEDLQLNKFLPDRHFIL